MWKTVIVNSIVHEQGVRYTRKGERQNGGRYCMYAHKCKYYTQAHKKRARVCMHLKMVFLVMSIHNLCALRHLLPRGINIGSVTGSGRDRQGSASMPMHMRPPPPGRSKSAPLRRLRRRRLAEHAAQRDAQPRASHGILPQDHICTMNV